MKKALIVINPVAGQKRANKYLTDIVQIFTNGGYRCTVMTTSKSGDGTQIVKQYGTKKDLVVAIGGDGTFNEVVAALIAKDKKIPIGYIPSGSTNDFANSLGLSKSITQAAKDIVSGHPVSFDVGYFNTRAFTYVASFGAFTKAAYEAPQNIKNVLGHFTYILEGAGSLSTLREHYPMKIEATDQNGMITTYDDDYVFGAFSNSTKIAGLLTISGDDVDLRDGELEMLLIKHPKNQFELSEIVTKLSLQDYNSKMLTFVKGSNFKIYSPTETPWTLDGEYQSGKKEIEINCIPQGIDLILPTKAKKPIRFNYENRSSNNK